jgi:hypothetical protein
VNKGYDIPAIQGESALQMAISLMLRRYMESDETPASEDPAGAPGLMALRFAWWLLDHAEELEAAPCKWKRRETKMVAHPDDR